MTIIKMSTICNFSDVDIYILYYLDIGSILKLNTLSTKQNILISNQQFVKEIRQLKQKYKNINKNNIIDYACKKNYISILEWVHNSINDFRYTVYSIIWASGNGYMSILEWLYKSGYEIKYSDTVICEASCNGNLNILVWLDKIGYDFRYYGEYCIDQAAENGHVDVLEWFDKSDYEFKYSEDALFLASKNGARERLQ